MSHIPATYVDANSFMVSDDRTEDFAPWTIVEAVTSAGVISHAAVISSSYSSPNTTVNLSKNILTSALALVAPGIIGAGDGQGLPVHAHQSDEYGGRIPYTNRRSTFRYKDADEVYVGDCAYYIEKATSPGAKDKFVAWVDSELTFVCGAAGSNAGSDALPTSGNYYIYIDFSAVQATLDRQLTAACLIGKTTAPTWNPARLGWYNGDDRCIWGIPTNSSSNIFPFEQRGKRIEYFKHETTPLWANDIRDSYNNTADVDFTNYANIPAFANAAIVVFTSKSCGHIYLKSGTNYGRILYAYTSTLYQSFNITIPTSNGGEFILRCELAGTHNIQTLGYTLPKGM